MSEPLRDYDTAAAWLGVPRRWLEDEVRAGRAPHTRLGKHVRFTQMHLDHIVRQGERNVHTNPLPASRPGPRPSGRAKRRKLV